MFASIAQPAPHPRRATPFLLALLLNGGVFGGLLLLGAREVARAAPAEVSLERPHELVLPPGSPAGGSPAPKPASRPKAAQRSAPAVVSPVTPPSAPVPPLPEPAPSADLTLTPVLDGGGDGPEGGGGGRGPGPGTGLGEGPGDGGGGGPGLRVVHWSEVAVKVRAQVRPSDYPAAASALDLPDARCVVRIEIDAKGVPAAVRVKTCPEVFRAAAENVARRYRFYPLMVEGRAVSAAFDLTINFRRD
jgi:hypothetical protein